MTFQLPMIALVKRELIVTLRRRRSFAVLLILGVISSFIVIVGWPDSGNIAEVGLWSQRFFMLMAGYVLSGFGLLLPAHASGAIVGERNRGTFDLLNMTLIRTTGIVAAKLLNTVGFALLILVSLMPLLACSFFLVGLEVGQIVRAMTIIFASVISATMFGILSSTMARRDSSAIGGGYLLMMFFRGGVAVLVGFLLWAIARADMGDVMGSVYCIIAPSTALTITLSGMGSYAGATAMVVGYQLAVAALCFFLTVVLLRRGRWAVAVKAGKRVKRARVRKEKDIGPMGRWARRYIGKGEIEDGRNPVFVRELRYGVTGRMRTLVGSFAVSMVIPGLMAYFGAFRAEGVEAVYVWLGTHMAITLLMAPSVLSTSFTKEFEDGNFEMLRITPLRPREVVMGKIKAGMCSLAPLFMGGVLWAAILSLIYPIATPVLVGGFVTLLVCCFECMGISCFASIKSRKSSTASLVSYALCALFVFGFMAYMVTPIGGFIGCIMMFAEGHPVWGILWWGLTTFVAIGIAIAFIGRTCTNYRRRMTDS